MDEVEVRVHYGAPSSRRDDDDSRAQAQSYQGWTSSRRISLSRLAGESPTVEMNGQDMTNHATRSNMQNAHSQTVIPATKPIYIEEIEEATRILQSQLLPSSSMVTKIPETVLKAVGTSQDRSISEGSLNSSSDPSYMKTPTFSRSNKRKRHSSDSDLPGYRIRRPALETSTPEREQPVTREQPQRLDIAKDIQANSGTKSDEIQSTSNLPTTYSLSDKSAITSKSNSNGLQRSNSAPVSSNSHSSRSTQASKAKRVQMAEQHADVQQNQRKADALPLPRPRPSLNDASVQEQQSLGANNQKEANVVDEDETQSETGTAAYFVSDGSSLRAPFSIPDTMMFIKSPPEPILNGHFETHISKQLAFLAQCAELKDVYKPVSITREMEKWDRGHWRFNISTWSSELQTSFWAFLSSFITKGAAGYMVMCCRGAENETEEEGTVKLYCYAEVAMHIYLLLYTASNSKVRNMGLQWKDSAGNVIIQMPKTS